MCIRLHVFINQEIRNYLVNTYELLEFLIAITFFSIYVIITKGIHLL